ncbi:MAG: methionyl-tRNA formyltransferase [Bacteroidota bacterium]|nr:methionyl-tRNA formyltransferase [Candidatus Kapabacteria bacterium]MDW8219934.1 methionyl-tRNA formyltransferase [Bacteroidota bacterium]
MEQTNIIALSRTVYSNYERLLHRTGQTFIFITDKKELTVENLRKYQPKYVFFPHWSYVIPASIFQEFECIIFHMTDVPFGRGGSPLQNLILRGIYETKISALRCTKELDAGPVYLKRPLSLYGSAEEIYMRAAEVIEEMIVEIVTTHNIIPVPQQGQVVTFTRRKPEESDISDVDSLEKVFDYIRMLDAEGYPRAYLETKSLRFEFSRASRKPNEILADVRITLK